MPSGPVMVVCAVAAILLWGGSTVGHAVKNVAVKTKHVAVHVVTLGKK